MREPLARLFANMKTRRRVMARTKRRPSFSWVLLLLIAVSRAQPSWAPASVFDSVLPELKQQTRIPILLPDHLPPLGGAQVFASAEGQAEHYAIRLESDPDCDQIGRAHV